MFCACIFANPRVAFSQGTYTLKGIVVDSISLTPIPIVAVTIPGTTLGTSTDSLGNYKISRIPRNSSAVTFRHLAYGEATLSFAVPSDGDTLTLNAYLLPTVLPLPGVTVTTQFKRLAASRDSSYRKWARVAVSSSQLKEERILDFDQFLHAHCPLAENEFDLFIDGLRIDADSRDIVSIQSIEAIYIWRRINAPVELRLSAQRPRRRPPRNLPDMLPIGSSTLDQFIIKPYIILILTK